MEEKDFKHKIHLKVRFSDLDAMRHVNNAAYLSFLEEGRISYFYDVMGMPKNSLNFGVIIARIEIDYLTPIMQGDELEVLSRVSKLGNKSADMEHIILVKNEGVSVAAAAAVTKLVTFDYKNQISIPVPDYIKEKVITFEGTEL